MYTFDMKGEVPAKKNSRMTLPNGKTIPSRKYSDWNGLARLLFTAQARSQGLKEPIDKPVSLTVTLTHGTLNRRDSDNALSSILDTLTDAGILSDDNWKIVRIIRILNDYRKDAPAVHITLEELEELP